MKKGLVLVLLVILSVTFLSCQRGTEQAGGAPRIALVLKTANNPFFIDMQKGAEEAARKLGVNLIVQAAEREVDVEKQMQIIENLIQTKVAALCVTPSGSREIVPAIEKANQAGIPVVIVDTRVDAKAMSESSGKVASFIGSDNYEGGKLAGEFIAKKLGGKGKVAVLEGIPGHETGDSRLKGFREALKAPVALVGPNVGLPFPASGRIDAPPLRSCPPSIPNSPSPKSAGLQNSAFGQHTPVQGE